jgi:hypothetical protein
MKQEATSPYKSIAEKGDQENPIMAILETAPNAFDPKSYK